MAGINTLISSAQGYESIIEEISPVLSREAGYISETMSKLQAAFGGDPQGQQAITLLYQIINDLNSADTALRNAKSGLETAIGTLRMI